MGEAELERGISAVGVSDRCFFIGPREEALVAAAEIALELRFPPTYRRFVRELGAGSVGSHEFYGVTDGDFAHGVVPNGIWLTLDERKNLSLPRHLLIVGDTGMGEYYAVDTSRRGSDNESPVVVWAPERASDGDELEVVAEDFGSFFLSAIEGEFGPS